MIYALDTNVFSQILSSMYPDVFKSFWTNFDALMEDDCITSTRETLRECEDDRVVELREWVKDRKELFPSPTAEEAAFVARIFEVQKFQEVIEQKKLLKGGRNADPFIVARAAVLDGTVVTLEKEPKNGSRIPNICRHFDVKCTSLAGFMANEGWEF